ncbi:DUF3006 domain-containing protein [Cytobacillus sp.]|uniref:DUF3006 domain-containing protein n=1 Tax=Cytobacillus sp. TaxID=2675269 RepID=UPI0028BE5D81|nr:DUF3006 domain-containing protein [Cytobacillus sp.]
MRGYFDRFEDQELAVILVEELNKQFVIAVKELPEKSKPGMWFDITIKDGKIQSVQYNSQATSDEIQKTNNLMKKICAKNKGSNFKQ